MLADIRTPETIVRRIAKKFNLDDGIIQDDSEHGAGVSFSNVTYAQVAPHVGLEYWNELTDIETFELHRSRVPTDVFKSIVMDIDVMLMQYGSPPEHRTEEARSRFFSPVFNHLVKLFTFMLRNEPESIIGGRIGTQGRIEHFFKVFGAIAILFIEIKLLVANDEERLKAIAQVIAEGDGCDLNNSNAGFSLPIHCIFTDGLSFEFFTFEKTPNPKFLRGCFLGDPMHLRRGLELPDFVRMESSLPFILKLRFVCETIFDVMLSAYIAGLKAYQQRLKEKGKEEGSKRPSFDGWDRALQSAELARKRFRQAEDERAKDEIAAADVTVEGALNELQTSTDAVPNNRYKNDLIMKDWDDDAVASGTSFFSG